MSLRAHAHSHHDHGAHDHHHEGPRDPVHDHAPSHREEHAAASGTRPVALSFSLMRIGLGLRLTGALFSVALIWMLVLAVIGGS